MSSAPAAPRTPAAQRAARRDRGRTVDADLLFDAPGPRGRRRIAVISGVVTLLAAALVAAALYQLARQGQLAYPKWRYFLGQSIVRAWIDTMRAVPMLLLIYFFLLAVPRFGPTLPSFWMLVIPIVMCTSATTAEVFRSGVLALDQGQTEAARALGLSRGQTMRLILAPQALRLMLPTLVTQLVTILKDSSLGYVVSYAELMYAGNVLITSTRQNQHLDIYLPAYIIVSVLYIVINWGLGALARAIEARTR